MATTQWSLVEAPLDPSIGSEQAGTRPVLVVSNDEFNAVIPNVTVLSLTPTPRRLYPFEVVLPPGAAGQLLQSIVMAHQIRTISQRRLGRQIGLLSDAILQGEVRQATKEHLDLT